MRFPRSKLITKIILFALIIYAGITLLSLRGRIEATRDEAYDLRKAVAEMEIANAQLEYNIEHYDEPDVIEEIARQDLGFVRDDDLVIFDAGSWLEISD